LFYRRRSEVPLGGPRFKAILDQYDNHVDPSEDDIAESGEDQGLVANSSLRGSSSALTGVGAAHRRPNLGLVDGAEMMTVNPVELEGLPAYREHELEDGAPLLVRDADMNEGLQLQESIEDEGIDMSLGYNSIGTGSRGILSSTWNFEGLGHNPRSHMISGTASDMDLNDPSELSGLADDRSDIVQHDSSASQDSLRNRLQDFENALPEGDEGAWEEPSPVPDVDEDDQMDILALHDDLRAQRGGAMLRPEFEVPAEQEGEEVEEPATEIHVEEGEGLRMD
jgi:ubiquitin carboxyl-terminal hydrolase 4/11/15